MNDFADRILPHLPESVKRFGLTTAIVFGSIFGVSKPAEAQTQIPEQPGKPSEIIKPSGPKIYETDFIVGGIDLAKPYKVIMTSLDGEKTEYTIIPYAFKTDVMTEEAVKKFNEDPNASLIMSVDISGYELQYAHSLRFKKKPLVHEYLRQLVDAANKGADVTGYTIEYSQGDVNARYRVIYAGQVPTDQFWASKPKQDSEVTFLTGRRGLNLPPKVLDEMRESEGLVFGGCQYPRRQETGNFENQLIVVARLVEGNQ